MTATNVAGTATSQPALVGITSTAKVAGAGSVVRTAIVHPNGNVYDQLVLTGASATITADAGKVTRISFIDLTDDIVQVEFSGAGTLSIVLDSSSGPALAVNYNQPDVSYMKGHASLVVAGARCCNISPTITIDVRRRALTYLRYCVHRTQTCAGIPLVA